jgi:hypothetical protein
VTLLRQIEVEIANGKMTSQACRGAQTTAQAYYRWRKEFSGLKLDQAKRLKELEKESQTASTWPYNAQFGHVRIADYTAKCPRQIAARQQSPGDEIQNPRSGITVGRGSGTPTSSFSPPEPSPTTPTAKCLLSHSR